MLTIEARLKGHALALQGEAQAASGSAGIDRVHFTFDEAWAELTKVALFWGSDGGEPYAAPVSGGGYAAVPWEAIAGRGRLTFGVYGTPAGQTVPRITSTLVKLQVAQGAWSEEIENTGDPTPTLIEQYRAIATQAVAGARAIAEANAAQIAIMERLEVQALPKAGGRGPMPAIDDGTLNAPIPALTICGRSTQAGTPAPDAPAAIATAGESGSIGIVSCGRNLLDHDAITAQTPVSGSVTITRVADGVRIASTSGAFAGGRSAAYKMPGTYTLSFDAKVDKVPGDNRIGFRLVNGGAYVNATSCPLGSGHYTVKAKIDEPFYVMFAVSRGTSGEGDATFTNIMLVKAASEAAPEADYEPYGGTTATVPTPGAGAFGNGLPGIRVASGGNYTDASGQSWICDTIDKAAGLYIRRVGVFTLNGAAHDPTTVETIGDHTRFWYQVDADGIMPADGTMCSHMPYDGSGYAVARPGFGVSANYPRNIWAKLPTILVGSTGDSVKAWMQLNPMTLVAALAEPVAIPLTDGQIAALDGLRSQTGSTTVYTTDEAQPELAIGVCIDIPTYIDSLMNAD